MLTPARLVLARRRRGMTLAELQRLTGISMRSLTAYEHGHQEPTSESLRRLAESLGVLVSFLLAPELDDIPVPAVSFRALSKMSATKRDSALSAGRIAISIQDWIDERFELPAPAVPSWPLLDPETAAETVRARWDLGQAPIKNMVDLLEAHGVRIFSLANDCADVDAFSLYWRGTPFVFLNTMKTAERSRFDAAHELGHLILHGESDLPNSQEAEREANRFAAALLMPASGVLAQGLRNATVDRIIAAKGVWRVAAMALTHRLRELHLLTEWGYNNNCVNLSRMGYRSAEPLSIVQRESSQALEKVFRSLRASDMTPARIAEAVHLTEEELNRHVFGLVITSHDGGAQRSAGARPELRVVTPGR